MVFYCTVPSFKLYFNCSCILDSHFHLQTLDQLPIVLQIWLFRGKNTMTTNAPKKLIVNLHLFSLVLCIFILRTIACKNRIGGVMVSVVTSST